MTPGCPLAGRAGALLPAQTGLFSEEEDEAAGAQACLPPIPPNTTPEHSEQRMGWAFRSPRPQKEDGSTFSGPASGLRTPLCTSGPPGSRQGILPSGPQLGQVHKLLPSLGREVLRQPSSDSLPVAAAAASGFSLLPVGRKSSFPVPYVAVTAVCRLSVPFYSRPHWSQPVPLLGLHFRGP